MQFDDGVRGGLVRHSGQYLVLDSIGSSVFAGGGVTEDRFLKTPAWDQIFSSRLSMLAKNGHLNCNSRTNGGGWGSDRGKESFPKPIMESYSIGARCGCVYCCSVRHTQGNQTGRMRLIRQDVSIATARLSAVWINEAYGVRSN